MKGSRQGRGLLAFYLARDPFLLGKCILWKYQFTFAGSISVMAGAAQVSSASTSYAIGIVIYKTMFFYVKILWLDNIKIFIL